MLINTSSALRIITVKPIQNGGLFDNGISNSFFSIAMDIFRFNFDLNWFPRIKSTKRNRNGSDYGLAPNRRQAIIWTNERLVYWRIYASSDFSEFSPHQMFLAWYLLIFIQQFASNFSYCEVWNWTNRTQRHTALIWVIYKVNPCASIPCVCTFSRMWSIKDTTIMVQTACVLRLREISVDYITKENGLSPCTIHKNMVWSWRGRFIALHKS